MLTDNFWWPLVFPIDTNHISQETGGDGEQQQVLSAPEAVEAEGQRVHDGEEFLQPLMTEQPTCREYHLKRVTVANCVTKKGGSLVEGFGWPGFLRKSSLPVAQAADPPLLTEPPAAELGPAAATLVQQTFVQFLQQQRFVQQQRAPRIGKQHQLSWDEVARTKFQDKYQTNWGGNPREKKSERNPKKNCTAACSAHWQAEPAGLRLCGQPLCKHL